MRGAAVSHRGSEVALALADACRRPPPGAAAGTVAGIQGLRSYFSGNECGFPIGGGRIRPHEQGKAVMIVS